MKQYKYFSPGFNSDVTVCFLNGILCAIVIDTIQSVAIEKAHFYTKEDHFLKVCKDNNIKVIEIDREITFEEWYKEYNYKVDKQPALKYWNKMPKEKKIRAFDFIKQYDSQLKLSGLAKKYPVTYLRSEIYM